MFFFPSQSENYLSITGRLPLSYQEDLETLKAILQVELSGLMGEEAALNFIEEVLKIQMGVSPGDKFSDIKVKDATGADFTVSHKEGEILMIDCWATWCYYCMEPMAENMEIAKKVEGKNIRLIGISCDQDVSAWKTMLTEKNWSQIEQYNLDSLLKYYSIKGIPCIIVVNQKGVIEYVGHPKTINLEEGLLNLAEGKEDCFKKDGSKKTAQNDWWNALSKDEQFDQVATINTQVKEAAPDCSAEFGVVTYTYFDSSFNPIYVCSPVIYGTVTEEGKKKLETFKATLEKQFTGVQLNVRVPQPETE